MRSPLSILVFVAGTIIAASLFYPPVGQAVAQLITRLPFKKQAMQVVQQANTWTDKILGENENKPRTAEQQIMSQIQGVSVQIMQQPEVQEMQKTINTYVDKRVEEVKDLTGDQIEKAKKDVRKQIYQEVCDQWLKE